ncbi:MAG: TatD family hydrolase [Candidatus Bathyarchaeia archaeon]
MHAHCGLEQAIYIPDPSIERIIKNMDRRGIKISVVSSLQAMHSDGLRGNRLLKEDIRKHASRLKGYWTINPNYCKELDEYLHDFSETEFVGFKFWSDYHKYPLTGQKYEPVLKYADEHGLLILMHVWKGNKYNTPLMVAKLAKKYPNITIIMGHSAYGEWEKAIVVAKKYSNVYLDLTSSYRVNGVVDWLVKDVGSERILFGTDTPWFDPYCGIGCILFSRITDEDKHNIFHRNAERLLKKYI